MIQFLLPNLSGVLRFEQPLPDDAVSRLEERIRAGSLLPGSRRRTQYEVAGREQNRLEFRAVHWLTAISVGLNQVALVFENPREVRYSITFWRWTAYAVALCGAIAGILLLVYALSGSMRESVRKEGEAVFFGMVFFWGLCWPWLLTALHKRSLLRVLRGIIERLAPPAGGHSVEPKGPTPER